MQLAVSISYDDNHYTTGTSKKVNVIVRLEFELAVYNVTVQHISHYATETPPNWKEM